MGGWQQSWMTLKAMGGYSAAVFWPNDLHQRTFHEVYRMGMPLFVPDALTLYRMQRTVNWGYSSYACRLPESMYDEQSMGLADSARSHNGYDPWWDSYSESASKVLYWQRFADWEQMPAVQRFASIPALLQHLVSIDFEAISR